MHAYLRVTAGADAGRVFNLTVDSTTTIGRGEKAEIRLNDQGVSRLHCQLQWEGSTFTLIDLDSVGGTFAGGNKIEMLTLEQDQEFQIGVTRLKLHTTALTDERSLLAAQHPAPAAAADEAVLTGKTISHYELGAVLAKGHTGVIYKARDTRAAREVAFKVLRSDFARDDEEFRRFRMAVTTTVELRHPNLIALYGAGRHGDTCWFAMEYIDGEPLCKLIQRFGTLKTIDWRFALSAGMQIAHALEAAHQKHLVHRNVSPASIMVRKKDHVAKLADMILAHGPEANTNTHSNRPVELARDLAYMAPERTKGDVEVDTRADVYGLGATLYALLTGKPPFEGKTLVETVAQVRQADPVPPRRFQVAIPETLQDSVMLMLSKRPDLRYQTPAQAARALERVARQLGPSSPS